MREEEVVTGIVLYATVFGEYDKRLVILTRERGKITVFANGARKPGSQFRAASQSFVMGDFTVRASRDSYTLIKVDVKEYFKEIAYDMEKMCYAAYCCELMSYYTREGDRCVANLNLLYVTLKTILAENTRLAVLKAVYELKLMDIEGQAVHAYACVSCGKKEELYAFDAEKGGLLCGSCYNGKKGFKVSGTLVYTLQYILSAEITRLYSFRLDEVYEQELKRVADSFVGQYIDKEFNSLEILASLQP